MKYLFIDIRKSDEVFTKRFSYSQDYKFYNIPMNMIRFNQKTIIEHLDYVDEIYIVCRSGMRSQFIKNKYFNDFDKIKVNRDLQFTKFKFGKNEVKLNDNKLIIEVEGSQKFNMYNMMRVLQVVLGSLIILLGGYTYYQIYQTKNKKINTIPLIILIIFGINALYNGLTSTCTISQIFQNHLN